MVILKSISVERLLSFPPGILVQEAYSTNPYVSITVEYPLPPQVTSVQCRLAREGVIPRWWSAIASCQGPECSCQDSFSSLCRLLVVLPLECNRAKKRHNDPCLYPTVPTEQITLDVLSTGMLMFREQKTAMAAWAGGSGLWNHCVSHCVNQAEKKHTITTNLPTLCLL